MARFYMDIGDLEKAEQTILHCIKANCKNKDDFSPENMAFLPKQDFFSPHQVVTALNRYHNILQKR